MKDKKAIIEELDDILTRYGCDPNYTIEEASEKIRNLMSDYAKYVIGEYEVGFMSTEVIGVNFEGKPLYNQNEYFEIWGRNQLRKEQRKRARK